MNLKFLAFISISFHNFLISQEKSIEKFWKDDNNKNYGYYDSIGNIYQIDNATKTTKLLYNNIDHLNNFKYIDDFHILNFNNNDKAANEKTCIIKNDFIKVLNWDDSTLYETIYNKNYYRINYFGNVYIKNLIDKSCTIKNINEDNVNYYQKIYNNDKFLFTINDKNEFNIYDLNINFLEKLSYKLKEPSCVKNFIVKKNGTHYNILILYANGKIDLLNVGYNDFSNTFKFLNRSVINVKLDVIDCEIKKNLIIVCCKDQVIFYKYNSFTASVQKIIDKKLSFPYYTSVTCLDKFLLFNNCHFIPYILINYNE